MEGESWQKMVRKQKKEEKKASTLDDRFMALDHYRSMDVQVGFAVPHAPREASTSGGAGPSQAAQAAGSAAGNEQRRKKKKKRQEQQQQKEEGSHNSGPAPKRVP